LLSLITFIIIIIVIIIIVFGPTSTKPRAWKLSSAKLLLVHGQVTIIFVVSVCLSVCLSVYAEFFSTVFDPISIKLGHMLYVWV